ncbi:MAG: acylphosphatase [Chlorobi bacterium]|nr:acylphosphatase [Chlorobiota bacterium]
MKRARIVVSGLVQGVGFRMFVERTAGKLGISGWVRNLPDGTVEIEAQGPETLVEELARQAAKGPSRSVVRGIKKEELTPEKNTEGFSVRF